MSEVESIIFDLVPPVWVIVAVLGALCAAVLAVIRPPPLVRFPAQLLAGLVGAAAGQLIGDSAGLGDLLLGDTHVVGVVIGALLAVVVVRRLAP